MTNKLFFPIFIALLSNVVCTNALGETNAAQVSEKAPSEKINAQAERSISRYSDKKLALEQNIPKRPAPILELWQGYHTDGPLANELELPTGMVISPNLIFYGNFRTGLQMRKQGSENSVSEWANMLDVYFDFRLTGTERFSLGIFPLHQGAEFTKYSFQPEQEFDNHINKEMVTLFFEGELSEMFPVLDMAGNKALDYAIAVGKQPILVQDGFLVTDIMDSIAITRNTIPLPGTSYARYSLLYGWGSIHRSNNQEDKEAELFGLLTSFDYAHTTFNIDLIYLDSIEEYGGDQFNVGISAVGSTILFDHHIDTTLRIVHSDADQETMWASSGTLLFSNFSWAPKKTDNIAYLSAFVGMDNYAPISRTAGTGGPLARGGLLFAGNRLASFGPAISNQADDMYGAALGYQMFFDGHSRSLVMEVAAKEEHGGDKSNTSIGLAARLSQSVGQGSFVSVDVYVVDQQIIGNVLGLRSEFSIMF
ncbi:hypothetical protein NBRC116592_31410 [Colwellia sp. KU-HH00111]|uniref:hypothetical protein n=1 Tax=Colwellia sp. KU-HH00111 TaxID=3127652 RepID=UPI00310C6247